VDRRDSANIDTARGIHEEAGSLAEKIQVTKLCKEVAKVGMIN